MKSGLLPYALPAALAACLTWFCVPARANGPQLVSTSVSPYVPIAKMWQGATVYGTGRPVTVRFVRSIADWGNQLNVMDPATGKEIPLWSYHRNSQSFHCPDSGGLAWNMGVRDSSEEIVFMLRTLTSDYGGKYCTGEACGPRYSGLNEPGRSRYYSTGEFAHLAGMVWARAARITQAQADSLPAPCAGAGRPMPGEGCVLFSFNDGANDTYGDLIFLVTGVEMDVERTAPPLPIDSTVPKLAPGTADCRIEAVAGGVTQGETFVSRPMALPVSAILPRHNPSQARIFMDQAWRLADPRRPDETQFPNGPDILVTTPGPFEFNLGFFTNQGGLVNRAKGAVTAAMLGSIPAGPDGRRSISLMWYPAAANGNLASTGAYVVKGYLRTLATREQDNPAERPLSCPEDKTELLSSFGYLRH